MEGLSPDVGAAAERRDQTLQGIGIAATMRIVAILIHSRIDFDSQISANAATFAVLLALARVRLPEVGQVFHSESEGFTQRIVRRESGLIWSELTLDPQAPGPTLQRATYWVSVQLLGCLGIAPTTRSTSPRASR